MPLRLAFWVVYREGVAPSPRASVHSSVTMMRVPFFLAMQVTCRGAWALGLAACTDVTKERPRKADVSCISSRLQLPQASAASQNTQLRKMRVERR